MIIFKAKQKYWMRGIFEEPTQKYFSLSFLRKQESPTISTDAEFGDFYIRRNDFFDTF